MKHVGPEALDRRIDCLRIACRISDQAEPAAPEARREPEGVAQVTLTSAAHEPGDGYRSVRNLQKGRRHGPSVAISQVAIARATGMVPPQPGPQFATAPVRFGTRNSRHARRRTAGTKAPSNDGPRPSTVGLRSSLAWGLAKVGLRGPVVASVVRGTRPGSCPAGTALASKLSRLILYMSSLSALSTLSKLLRPRTNVSGSGLVITRPRFIRPSARLQALQETGATGLEPATSGVTGRLEGRHG
jgi:hypothetical protein